MTTLMLATETGLRRLAFASAVLGGAALLVMLCIVTANIALRPFGGSLRGTVEVSGYLCALAIGLCLPAAQLTGSHINAGLCVSSLPLFLQRVQNIGACLVSMVLLGFVAWELYDIAAYARDMGEYIEGFAIPYYPMTLGFAYGAALHAVLFIHMLFSLIVRPERMVKEGA